MDGTGGTGATARENAEAPMSVSPVPPTIPLRYVSFFTGGGWIVWDEWEQLQVSGIYKYGAVAQLQADRLNGQLWRLAVSEIQSHECDPEE